MMPLPSPPEPLSSAASPSFAPSWIDADAYLFDIDGTLLNSRDAVHYNAFHFALREVYGVDSRIDGVPVHGNTDIGIMRAVLARERVGEAAMARGLPRFKQLMCADAERNASGLRPEVCASVAELVKTLASGGKLLGIASGNLEAIGWMKLRAAGLRDHFAFGSFSDHAEKREEIFRAGVEEARRRTSAQSTVAVVGDTPSDILAARAAGIPVVAVATGIYSMAELREHAPDACFGCCSDILRVA